MNSKRLKIISIAATASVFILFWWRQDITNIVGKITRSVTHDVSVETLITEEESRLPLSRGLSVAASTQCDDQPKIIVKSPLDGSTIQRPISVEVEFQPASSKNPINIDSFKLLYMVSPQKDLTEKVRRYIRPDGISDRLWMVPSGNHWLRLQVSNQRGCSALADIHFTII